MNSFFHVSERNHAGLIFMTELATAYASGDFVTVTQIAERMRISQGYLEEIATQLKRAGLICGKKGPSGGYRLARSPGKLPIAQILTALEGPLALVECQSGACSVQSVCHSRSLWVGLQKRILEILKKTFLSDLVQNA